MVLDAMVWVGSCGRFRGGSWTLLFEGHYEWVEVWGACLKLDLEIFERLFYVTDQCLSPPDPDLRTVEQGADFDVVCYRTDERQKARFGGL